MINICRITPRWLSLTFIKLNCLDWHFITPPRYQADSSDFQPNEYIDVGPMLLLAPAPSSSSDKNTNIEVKWRPFDYPKKNFYAHLVMIELLCFIS